MKLTIYGIPAFILPSLAVQEHTDQPLWLVVHLPLLTVQSRLR
jgi:hypothetical protein